MEVGNRTSLKGSRRPLMHSGDGFLLPSEAVVEEVQIFFGLPFFISCLSKYDGTIPTWQFLATLRCECKIQRLSIAYGDANLCHVLDDNEVLQTAFFCSRGKLVHLRWQHLDNGVVLAQSSQPFTRFGMTRSPADEKLVATICNTANQRRKLYIADARPKKNALANGAMGGGSESSANYLQSELDFLVARSEEAKVEEEEDNAYKLTTPTAIQSAVGEALEGQTSNSQQKDAKRPADSSSRPRRATKTISTTSEPVVKPLPKTNETKVAPKVANVTKQPIATSKASSGKKSPARKK